MKHLKLIIALLISTAVIFSCNPKAKENTSNKPDVITKAPEKMSAEALKVMTGIEIPGIDYSNGSDAARGKPKANAVIVSVSTDLTIAEAGGIVTGSVSANAQWAGIQKFIDPNSNDGAVAMWEAQRNYSTPPGSGATTSCHVDGAGYYRVWSSDFDYNIHLSSKLPV